MGWTARTRVTDDGHHRGRCRREGIDRQDREDGAKRAGRVDAVQPDEAPGDARRGKVGVGDHQLVPVAHGREDVKQVGAEQGIEALQHGDILFRARRHARRSLSLFG